MGPASLLETWSGVPFFLLRELKSRGIIVREVNLEPHRYIKWIYNRIIMPFVSLFVKGGELSIYRSLFFRIYQFLVLRCRIKTYKSADVVLGITSFNIAIPKCSQTTVLFSDWPFSYSLLKQKVQVGRYQNYYLSLEDKCMRNADLLVSLFPTCANYINARLKLKDKAIYLGVNVVNSLMSPPSPSVVIKKSQQLRLVFIGRYHYISGAISLLKAYSELRKLLHDCELDIIGLQLNDFPKEVAEIADENVRFWGYLDKGIQEQCDIYYDILNKASLYVNTTPGWVGYTSMIEAMCFYTPVIVYPCVEFIDEFGENISFGTYADSSNNLANVILNTWKNSNYAQMANNAHFRVADYTWQTFTDRLIGAISHLHK